MMLELLDMPPKPANPELQSGSGLGAALGSAFRCIVADPPWDFKMGRARTENDESESRDGTWAGYKGIADLQYPTMSVEEIAALKVPAADAAHCYIWTINRYIEQTYAVARAWGFDPAIMLYWLKQPMGLGLGGAFCGCVEPILFCRRGSLPAKSRCDRNWWGWPRGKHSAKPEEFQTVVESVSPGPYLEMFARRKRHGWASWGNEIANDVEMPNAKLTDRRANNP